MKKIISIFLIIFISITLSSCAEFIGLREVAHSEGDLPSENTTTQETAERQRFLPPSDKSDKSEKENIETISVLSELLSAPAGTIITEEQLEIIDIAELFTQSAIDDSLFERINGKSYEENQNITTDDLAYLRVLHKNADGQTLIGEMIVNAIIGDEILNIFKQLYEASYPIEMMVLIDEYDGDDERSMQANNTSAFNYRQITGSTALSNHSYGMAIDINPFYNPYISGDVILPEGSEEYADRTTDSPYMIRKDDLCYELFTSHGFSWGGEWISPIDYQHFEKIIE